MLPGEPSGWTREKLASGDFLPPHCSEANDETQPSSSK